MFFNKYKRMEAKAEDYSYSVDLSQFSDEELCDIYCRLNCHEWVDRLGPAPKDHDSDYGFCYSCALMDRIADRVGDKAVMKWWHIHELGRSEQEFEGWYEKRVQKIVLRH